MTDRHTSRVGVATLALCERLMRTGVIPLHPVTGQPVDVTFGDEDPAKGAEKVCVLAAGLGDDAEQEWARLGPPGRDERFGLRVVGRSLVPVPNQTNLDILRRLIAITDAIQGELYDHELAKNVIALGYPGETLTWAGPPSYDVFPTGEGPMGLFEIPIRCQAQI